MREYIVEADFADALEQRILPYLHAHRDEPVIQGHDGAPLYVAHYRADRPRGTVFWLHGFSENAEKFREAIYYCLLDGLSVVTYDHRGHGRSPHKAPLGIIHIDRFEEYLMDFEAVFAAFSDTVPAPLYLFAHSMGGGIAALLLERHPAAFQKALLSAPMLDLQYKGPLRLMASAACHVACLAGRGQEPITKTPKDYLNEPFETSSYLSPARFYAVRDTRRSDPKMSGGAPSYAWSAAAFGVRRKIFSRGAIERIKTEVLILAAEHEHLVSSEAQIKFAKRLPHGRLETVEGAKHEIFFTDDARLFPILDKMLNFFS